MSELSNILTPLLPIVGIVVGASIQSHYAKKAENKKQSLAAKTNAYVDYLECVSHSAHIDRNNKNELTALFSKGANAKARICVYGSTEVIAALAKFETAGANLASKENTDIFVNLCTTMRKDHLGERGEKLLTELSVILVGNRDW